MTQIKPFYRAYGPELTAVGIAGPILTAAVATNAMMPGTVAANIAKGILIAPIAAPVALLGGVFALSIGVPLLQLAYATDLAATKAVGAGLSATVKAFTEQAKTIGHDNGGHYLKAAAAALRPALKQGWIAAKSRFNSVLDKTLD